MTSEGKWFHNEVAGSWEYDAYGDTMATVRAAGPSTWDLCWWPGPVCGVDPQRLEFKGTLEEAKALAITLMRLDLKSTKRPY